MTPDNLLSDLQGSIRDRTAQPVREKQLLKLLVTGDGMQQVEIFDKLRTTHLTEMVHKEIYNHLTQLYVTHKEINPTSLLDNIRLQTKPEKYDEMTEAWAEIMELPVNDTPGNILDVLHTTRKNRILYNEIFQTAARLFTNNEATADQIAEKIANSLLSLEDEIEGITIGRAAANVVERALNPEKAETGLLTGLRDFDVQFGGVKKDRMFTIAGYSGNGKTAYIIDLICRLLKRHTDKVAIQFFSLEMSEERIAMRILCWLAGLTEHQLDNQSLAMFEAGVTKPLTNEEVDRLLDAQKQIEEWEPILEVVYQSLDEKDIRHKGRRFALKHHDKHIIHILDHLGEVDKEGKDNRNAFDSVMNVLKDFCRNHKATCFPLVQLAKETETSREQENLYYRPKKGFIMESVGVEAKSDNLILLWRPSKKWDYINYAGEEGFCVINLMFAIVGKNRDGDSGNDILFDCLIQYNQLFDFDHEKDRSLIEGETREACVIRTLPGVTAGEDIPLQVDPNDLPF